ncbi:MAG: hypothetical protein CSA09_03690 [Candidatus Contendobacter odensis]|uniref:Uncharacterized protein n=1 Tax=Candidatus Contendibacter odensensis TaxID=1400860 RepID=A0A2G6PF42_9GAMM|nr:MAG: hypothetical protein CSA09_03690 [Candidatus Contendobacter odensis]
MSDVDPIIGNWYRNHDTGNDFEVIATDEDIQLIEIQYFDGELEELDLDAWHELPIELIEGPDHWSGSFDDTDANEDYDEADENDQFSHEDYLFSDRENS